jgi:phosphoesterase RecJ-like protein
MATDSGWFRFGNTDARLLRRAARLTEAGVRADRLYARLYDQDSPAKLRLLGAMLGTLELHAGGRIAIACISQEMFGQCDASPSDTEDLIQELYRLGGVIVAALLVELPNQLVKVSLRSRCALDVNAVAKGWGGGGHRPAAGARRRGSLPDVRREVIERLSQELARIPPNTLKNGA